MGNVIQLPHCNKLIARDLPAAGRDSVLDREPNVVPFPNRSPAVFCFPMPGDLSPKELSRQVCAAAKRDHLGELVSIGTAHSGEVMIISSVELERLADVLDAARECVANLLIDED